MVVQKQIYLDVFEEYEHPGCWHPEAYQEQEMVSLL